MSSDRASNASPEFLAHVHRATHQLNNVLGPLLMLPELIKSELPHHSTAQDDLLLIQEAARQASAIVSQLRERTEQERRLPA